MLTSGDIWRRGRRGCLRRRGGRRRKKKKKEGRRRTSYIKSNNPHLTGGEKMPKNHPKEIFYKKTPQKTTAFRGSSASGAGGLREVATLQKRQPRVQVSPMIITVAVPPDQHSPALGHRASWHTVLKPVSLMVARTSLYLAVRWLKKNQEIYGHMIFNEMRY